MPTAEQSQEISRPILVTQIIAAAIAMGPVFFLAIALFLPAGALTGTPVAGAPLLSYVGVALSLFMLALRAALVRFLLARDRASIARGEFVDLQRNSSSGLIAKTGDVGRLLILFQKQTILSVALTEGCAFLLIVAYIVERQIIALGGAIFIILFLASQIPSRARIERWIEAQYALLEEERRAASRSS